MRKMYKGRDVKLFVLGKEVTGFERVTVHFRAALEKPPAHVEFQPFGKPGKKKKQSARSRRADPRLLEEVRSRPCLACLPGAQRSPTDVDHITTVGAGGGDHPDNLWPLCRDHHIERHSRGLCHMALVYPGCHAWLEEHGRLEEIIARRLK